MKFNLPPDITGDKLPPKVLKRILEDPNVMEKLSDRVYELLRDDLYRQRERRNGYGRRF
jgi:predicted DCC family thiol-disulfide oxidoreductase YuxK